MEAQHLPVAVPAAAIASWMNHRATELSGLRWQIKEIANFLDIQLEFRETINQRNRMPHEQMPDQKKTRHCD
ncbi:hypothetical protein [Stenotrophomonas sp. ZAC14D2_NAIMI4_7]|uniref:hypothetical protein n=1 Tax=Stenotrophomonas sp. ZAC14D2_NAIMI4_7 TaxID=2072405 RepID=UPI00131ED615|nr:hypothetical protein [Stenotrophomonas sp. ZAC14D2_NAIMI4_7]